MVLQLNMFLSYVIHLSNKVSLSPHEPNITLLQLKTLVVQIVPFYMVPILLLKPVTKHMKNPRFNHLIINVKDDKKSKSSFIHVNCSTQYSFIPNNQLNKQGYCLHRHIFLIKFHILMKKHTYIEFFLWVLYVI